MQTPELVNFEFSVHELYGLGKKGNKIFLAQTLYSMSSLGSKTYEEGLRFGLAIYGCFYVIIAFLIAIQYIGMETMYKIDNFLIFMQVMALSLSSMPLNLTQRDYYRFLYGFRWSTGHWHISHLESSIIFSNNPTYL